MINNNSWESLVWIVIWVFILSFIIMGIVNLIITTNKVVINYEEKKVVNILTSNTLNVIKYLDTSGIAEGETFYLYKDSENKVYKVMTWGVNESYEFIDRYWNYVENIDTFEWNVFSRTLKRAWELTKVNVEMY